MVSSVRVRIAPSPTGPLHVGTARTALVNFLFARRQGGTFILRIEDTDTERSKPEYAADILEELRWLGVAWDEGPDVGGASGPYLQSQRLDRYADALTELLRSGAEVEEGGAVLFRVTDRGPWIVDDLIRGSVRFPAEDMRDFVIAKPRRHEATVSSGGPWLPLFHLAVVVDDAAMGITHVIRGEDHLSNTPKHMLLQRALGLPTPHYAHVPLLLDTERHKLSKRHGAIGIREYRAQGYLPEALVNFLALLGWNPKSPEEVFTLDELIERFNLGGVQKGGAVFDLRKLDWLQRQHLRRVPLPRLVTATQSLLSTAGVRDASAALVERAVTLWRERGGPLAHLPREFSFLFVRPRVAAGALSWSSTSREKTRDALSFSLRVLESLPSDAWADPHTFQEALLTAIGQGGEDRASVLWPLRVALSGQEKSPSVGEIAWVVGKSETLARVAAAKDLLVRPT